MKRPPQTSKGSRVQIPLVRPESPEFQRFQAFCPLRFTRPDTIQTRPDTIQTRPDTIQTRFRHDQTRFRHDSDTTRHDSDTIQTRHPYDTPPIAGDFHLSDFTGSLQLLHNRGAALPSWRTGPFRRIQRALRRSSGTMSLKVTCPCWSGASPCSVNSFGLRYPRVGWSRWSSDHHT